MPVSLDHHVGDHYLEVRLNGKLTADDYQTFEPEFERLLKEHSALRLLVVMDNFHGWTMGALWQDLKFDAKHFRDIRRLAIVGDSAWEKGMATFCKPFTSAEVKYFPIEQTDQARDWLSQTA